MIICDTHRFIFIHIPKCAGTSVRKALAPYDETNGQFARRAYHETLGHIDYGHIPLFVLKKHFSDKYEKLLRYDSYAVLRDPYSRFPSSLAQHLRMYRQVEMRQLSPKMLKRVIDETLNILGDHADPMAYLPHQYIHFQRQKDFIYLEEIKITKNLYTTHIASEVITSIGDLIGKPLKPVSDAIQPKENETQFYRSAWIRMLVEHSKPLLKAVLREERWESLKQATRDRVFTSSDRRLQAVFDSDHVRDFIADYYQDDIDLFETVHQSELISTLKDNTAHKQPATNTSS